MPPKKNIAIAIRIDEPYPHHQLLLSGIQRFAKENPQWNTLIDEHPGYKAHLRGKNYAKYDGVIARADLALQKRMGRMGIPLVNTHYQYSNPKTYGVYSDPTAMGELAAEHLIDRGFRRLIVVIDDRHRHSYEAVQAFQKRAEEDDISDIALVKLPEEPYELASYWIEIEKLLAEQLDNFKPPVGVFIETPPLARLLIQMGMARGWRVPYDIAVLCHYNLKAVVDISPQISSIQFNYELVGYKAAEMLSQLMSGEPVANKALLIPPIGINGRESTDYFAVQDELVADALRYISSRLDQKLRIDDIAYELAVSASLLKSRFNLALGRGVGQEIRRLRIEVAKRMLSDPDHSIARVAKASGFTSADILSQVFRRELGVTPTEYRNNIFGDLKKRRNSAIT